MFRLLKFAKLPSAEKILFIEAFLFVPTVRIAIWFVPFRILQKGFSRFLSANVDTAQENWSQIKKIVRQVRLVSRFVPFANCLTQALSALYLLRLNGQEAELKIGVANGEKNGFEAHAWLEKNGRIIIGKLPEHGKYMTLKHPQGQNL